MGKLLYWAAVAALWGLFVWALLREPEMPEDMHPILRIGTLDIGGGGQTEDVEPGSEGTEAVTESGTETVTESGTETVTESGTETVTEPGTESGMETVTEPGTESGTEMEPGTQSDLG